MNNQNGQLVLQTLENLQNPATLGKISQTIAKALEADVNEVKETVKKTLDGGVHYGYIQKLNQKYYKAPLDVSEILPNTDADIEIGDKRVQDRSARRRRRASRRRSRSRMGSRRRRSRR
ncbi:uncharacterized protein ACRADG_005321 [Cochliomyia hominivorax]